MLETCYFSDEWNQEEKDNLIKKTIYYMEYENLPSFIMKPEQLIYDEAGHCVGYSYQMPSFACLTLKEVFQPENVEKYHLCSEELLSLAEKVLGMLKELAIRDIYPGFLTLDHILVDKEEPWKRTLISNPEYFQVGSIPSSHPWYPSDSRLFEEEFELFDAQRQKRADGKLIYKLMTAASKGNAKIPPNQKAQDYSWMFWNILSREWKDFFLSLPERDIAYEEIEALIRDSLEEENSSTECDVDFQKVSQKKKAYALIVVLRQADKSVHDISRELYLLQEKLELHPQLDFDQGFVLGNKHPFIREFRHYPHEFRSQLGHVIAEYSFGEALILSAEMMETALRKEERPSFLCILIDGEIKNDKLFQTGLKKLEKLTENWYTKLILFPASELKGEGYQKLNDLCMKGNQK